MTDLQEWLFAHQDLKYRDFNAALIPNIEKDTVIGVRTPELKAFAKELMKEKRAEELTAALPHQYFEENQLHAFILNEYKDFETLMPELERFLPMIDNWATCDQLRPKLFKKHTDELLPYAKSWLARSEEPYVVRYGIGVFLSYYLDDAFDAQYLQQIAGIRSEEYYVNIMIAWYLATALAKQYEAAIAVLESRKPAPWVQNKTIQKAIESRRIPDETKAYLRTLKERTR
ncbi:MAG: DNA alkylation repair protein [Lachnospiraceae bacterium]|nr:DNA alkylation repair protein [Lachnospiraceae bacterium]